MYEVTLIFNEYTYVDDDLKKVEVKKTGKCATWDDVETFLGAYVDMFNSVKAEIKFKEVGE